MISETFFSTHYGSVWRNLAPAMEDYVRRTNMDGYEREWRPLSSTSDPKHRSVINEASFRAFAELASLPREQAVDQMKNAVERGFKTSQEYIYGKYAEDLAFVPNDADKREAFALAGRLFTFFKRVHGSDQLLLSPEFRGNGIISRCRGDILAGENGILYEVKSGDRPFRSVDYRQLSVYAALHYAALGQIFDGLALINPRRGVYVIVRTEEFSLEVSGLSASSYFQSMIHCFSANLVSD